jgi:hypothetical protein
LYRSGEARLAAFLPQCSVEETPTGSHKILSARKTSIVSIFNRFVNKPVHFPVLKARNAALMRPLAICTLTAANAVPFQVE